MNSNNYRHIGTKHRPSIFSDYIQRVIDFGKGKTISEAPERDETGEFCYPTII